MLDRLGFYSQSRGNKIAWVNGGSNYDFAKVAKCLVIYNRLRLASTRVWDSTLIVLLADLCGRHSLVPSDVSLMVWELDSFYHVKRMMKGQFQAV